EHGRRDEVVRESVREPCEDVRGRRSDDDDVGLSPHRDVTRGALVLDLEHLDLHRPVRERLEGEGPHELRGRSRHDALDGRARLRQSTRELDRLVGGDRAGDAEHDEAPAQRFHQAFSSYSRRSPSSVRSSSTFSIPFASGAIVGASPPVAITVGFAGSSAMMRASRPSTRPTYPNTIPERRQSAVFFPIAVAGGVRGTRKRRDARPKSDSAETSSPGANEPPRKSPSALTTSKFVVVPKSTTTAGPPYRRCAASVFAMRSAPTSDGLSTRSRTPVFTPGPTTNAARSR